MQVDAGAVDAGVLHFEAMIGPIQLAEGIGFESA